MASRATRTTAEQGECELTQRRVDSRFVRLISLESHHAHALGRKAAAVANVHNFVLPNSQAVLPMEMAHDFQELHETSRSSPMDLQLEYHGLRTLAMGVLPRRIDEKKDRGRDDRKRRL